MIQDGRKHKKQNQTVDGGKACLNSQVFIWRLKMPREGAMRISGGRLFQRRGATAKKVRFLVFFLPGLPRR